MNDQIVPIIGLDLRISFLAVLSGLWLFTGGACRKATTGRAPSVNERPKAGVTNALPAPDIKGQPILQVLQQRRTSRDYATTPIAPQTLSNLLWAAYGVNRSDGKRTAPSAHDWQYIDVYVADSSGLYRFESRQHGLVQLKSGDIRKKTGIQDYVTVAPISLIYVSDGRKFPADVSQDQKLLYGATTAGAIAQNVYVFCAANSLSTGVRSDIDRDSLHAAMGLAPEQSILLAQSAGYPSIAK
jgi:nitroreductase